MSVPLNKLVLISALPKLYQLIVKEALAVQPNAYAPYSNFQVGAALLCEDDSIVTGANYENCVFQGICAERCAIVAANAMGKRRMKAVAICGSSRKAEVRAATPADVTCPPCGICRQGLVEVMHLSERDLDLVLITADQKRAKVVKLTTMIPDSFGPKDCGFDIKALLGEQTNASTVKETAGSKTKTKQQNDAVSKKNVAKTTTGKKRGRSE